MFSAAPRKKLAHNKKVKCANIEAFSHLSDKNTIFGKKPDFETNVPEQGTHPAEDKYFNPDILPLDPESKAKILKEAEAALEDAIKPAYENMSKENAVTFHNNMKQKLNNFRQQLTSDGPIKIKAPPTVLKPGASSTFLGGRAHKYSDEEMEFLSALTKRFIKAGLIVSCETSQYCSPALVVRKPNNRGFRLVVDLRRANALVQQMCAPIVHLDMVRSRLQGSKVFSSMDLTDGFFQVQQDKTGSELYTFRTHEGLFRMLRTPQGATNSSGIFQSIMNVVCKKYLFGKTNGVIPYIDDLLIYAESDEKLIEIHKHLNEQFEKYNVKVKLTKSVLGSKRVEWCGFLIDKNGISQPESRIDKLLNTATPVTAYDLTNFLGAVNWMRQHLPRYDETIKPLLDLKLEAQRQVGSSKATKLRTINLARAKLWTVEHDLAFKNCLNMIQNSVTLSHPNVSNYTFNVFSDASDVGWGGYITQTPKSQDNLPIEERNHQPLGFCGGRFRGSQLAWSTFSQEAYGLIATVEKYRWLLHNHARPFAIYTDHRNLTYIFQGNTSERKQTQERVKRWAILLAQYNFTISHISGEKNLMADIISRWPYASSDSISAASIQALDTQCVQNLVIAAGQTMLNRLKSHNQVPDHPQVDGPRRTRNHEPRYIAAEPDFVSPFHNLEHLDRQSLRSEKVKAVSNNLPTASIAKCTNKPVTWNDVRTQASLDIHHLPMPNPINILAIQKKFLDEDSVKYNVLQPDLIYDTDIRIIYSNQLECFVRFANQKQVWVPSKADHLKICITISAHSSIMGHLGEAVTLRNVQEHYYWKGMQADIHVFCSQCLHCLPTKLGKTIPRPLGSTIHGVTPNHVVRADFLYIGKSTTGKKSVLILKDDHTQYCHAIPVKQESAYEFSMALLRWAAFSRMPAVLAVDNGSHFINTVVKLLSKSTGIHSIIPSIAYVKQTHGGAENINKLFLHMLQSLCSENQLDFLLWPTLVPIVNHALNHRPSSLLNFHHPVELFTGQAPQSKLKAMVYPNNTAKQTICNVLNQVNYNKDFDQELLELRVMLNNLHRKVIVEAESTRATSREFANRNRSFRGFNVGDFVIKGIPTRQQKLKLRWVGPLRITHVISDKVYLCEDLITTVTFKVHANYLKLYNNTDLIVTPAIKKQIAFDTLGNNVGGILAVKRFRQEFLIKLSWKNSKLLNGISTSYHPISLAHKFWTQAQLIKKLKQLGTPNALAYLEKIKLSKPQQPIANSDSPNDSALILS